MSSIVLLKASVASLDFFFMLFGNCRLGYYSVITPSHTLRFEGPRENVPPPPGDKPLIVIRGKGGGGEKKAGRVLF